MALNEYSLSVNSFLEPDVKEGPKAICSLLVHLLLLEPNTFDTHPDMGVGIVSKYRYGFEGHADELKRDFQNQINTYLPVASGVNIYVTEKNHMYFITATINNVIYGISIDKDFNIKSNYKSISDLK